MGRKAENLVGRTFGRLTALSLSDRRDGSGGAYWWCECECRTRTEVAARLLRAAKDGVKSCGCRRGECALSQLESPPIEEMVGTTHGHLTVVAFAGVREDAKQRHTLWRCSCVCGAEHVVTRGYLWQCRERRQQSCRDCLPKKT